MSVRTERVAQSMTRSVIYLEGDHSISEAWDIMRDCGIRHIPVVDQNICLTGIVSDRDILLHTTIDDEGLRELADLTLDEVMSDEPITCSTTTPIYRAASIMVEAKIDCLPVIGAKRELVGLITSSDIMSLLTCHDEGDWNRVLPFEFDLNRWGHEQHTRQI